MAAGSTTGSSGDPTGIGAVRRALGYLRSYKLESGGAFVALLLVTGANLLTPLLIGRAIDDGISARNLNVIYIIVVGLVGVALVRGLFTFLQGYLAERASQGVAYDLRNALFERIGRLSFSYYDRVQTGQLVTRLTNDVEQIRTFTGSGVVQLGNAAVMLVGTTALLLYLDWQLALVALAIIPPIVLVLIRFVQKIRPLFGEVQQTLGRLNTVLQEDLSGVRVIRAFAREDYEVGRYRNVNDELLDKNLQTVRTFAGNFPLIFLLSNLGTLGIVLFGGLQVIDGRLSIGELVAFNAYLGFLLQPILTIGFLSASISRAGASSQRVFEVLDAPIDVKDKPDAVELPPIHCRVEFEDVCFRYPGRDGEIDFEGLTSSELLARSIPGVRLVKAFNTMYYETLANEGRTENEERLVLFVAGDDEEAKATVSELIEQIGFAPVDTGSLREGGRKQHPGSPIYNNPMTEDQAREILETLD